MRGKKLSQDLVEIIFKKRRAGSTIKAISKDLNRSYSTIRSILNRADKQKTLGRPKKTTSSVDRRIILAMKRHRFSSNQSIADSFNVSRDTIRRRGIDAKIKSRIAVIDRLTTEHKKRRKSWCRAHKNVDFRDWIFSDESSFEVRNCSSVQRSYVHRAKNLRFSPCCVLPCPTQSRAKLMVWGCITATGPGPLTFVEGHIDSKKYIEILQEQLEALLDEIPLSRRFKTTFQHDNAPPHVSKYSKAALSKMHIIISSWPALSPDLNIIENVWALLKRAVRKHKAISTPSLKRAIMSEWSKIVTKRLCERLYYTLRSSTKC